MTVHATDACTASGDHPACSHDSVASRQNMVRGPSPSRVTTLRRAALAQLDHPRK